MFAHSGFGGGWWIRYTTRGKRNAFLPRTELHIDLVLPGHICSWML